MARLRQIVRRPLILLALAIYAFAQAGVAMAGCLGGRIAASASVCAEGFDPAGALLCRVHCQAEDQTLDAPQISVPSIETLWLDELEPGRVLASSAARVIDTAVSIRGSPPLNLLLARSLT